MNKVSFSPQVDVQLAGCCLTDSQESSLRRRRKKLSAIVSMVTCGVPQRNTRVEMTAVQGLYAGDL